MSLRSPGVGVIGTVQIADGSISNVDVNTSAAIAVSKLATITASKVVVTDSSGFLTNAATSSTELGYVSGVTSAIQTQFSGKAARPTFTSAALASDFTVSSATFANVTGLAVTVTTPAAGENAMFSLYGAQVDAGSSGTLFLAYSLNGGGDVILSVQSLAASFGGQIGYCFPITLTSGSNTIQLRAKKSGGNQVIQGNSTNGFTTLFMTQFG